MKALVLAGPGELKYMEVETPEPKEGEALIKVAVSGICGSDVPRVNSGAAHFYPIILGHEFSGVVEGVGPGVEGIAAGRKAAAAPLLPCMKCGDCLKGDYALCKDYSFTGSRKNGSFAEYVAVPARNVVLLDDGADLSDAALFEPSTVALHGLFQAGFQGGSDVLVLGFGTIGYFALQWARLLGAKRVCVADVSEERLRLALRLGADRALDVSSEALKEEALAFTKGQGFPFVFETAGQNSAMALAFELASNRASVCFVGTSPKDLSFDWRLFEKMNRKEFRLTGSWMSYSAPFPGREWAMTGEYLGSGRLVMDKSLVFRTFPLEEGAEAFRLFKTPGAVKGKILLKCL